MSDNTPLLIALDAAMAKLDAVEKTLNESRRAIVEADYLAREGHDYAPAKPVVFHVDPEEVNRPEDGLIVSKAWADALSASIKANGPMMVGPPREPRPRPSFLDRLKAWLGGLRR